MHVTARNVIQSTFEASSRGSMHFGQVIDQLAAAKVESYHVDYRAGRCTYYVPDGKTMELAFEPSRQAADAFETDTLRSAIRGAQQGKVMYPEFKRLSERAGCIGYIVWIAGRHVSYFGRKGENHVERFPD